MRHVLGLTLAFSVVLSGCRCGGAGSGTGTRCMDDAECESMICGANGLCAPAKLPDGGINTKDGGVGGLMDGGTCLNLQCKVASCTGATTTTVSGTVFDPGGSVPLYNVTVYVPNTAVKPLTTGASCEACGSQISGSPVAITLTGADGKFTLTNVPSGANIPLVVQIGKWRRQLVLPSITSCQDNPLDPALARLPRNQAEGDLPQMAISSGRADAFECLLRKIGIADAEFTTAAGAGRVHYFVQNGMDLAGGAPAGSTLWSDAGTLTRYDVVILPCEGGANNKPNAAVRNVVNYTNGGGRVFATHYSYVWTRPGWPQAAGWQPGLQDLYNSIFDVTVDQTFPKGQAFAQWLVNVGASPTSGTLGLRETRHDVTSVSAGSTRWLFGDVPGATPSASIQHLTFNTPFLDAGTAPDGGSAPQCGRVVFSDFHVTAGATDGGDAFPSACADGALTAQEKALEFMLFDLSACVQDDHEVPTVCAAVGSSCKVNADCCSGLLCQLPGGAACTGSGCTCQPGIN